MCITKEQLEEQVKKAMLELMPVAIAKGINEAATHLKMSDDTKRSIDEHEKRISIVESLMNNNEEFHKRIEPLLMSIQEDIRLKKGIKNLIFTSAKIIGSITIILGGFFAFIEYIRRN